MAIADIIGKINSEAQSVIKKIHADLEQKKRTLATQEKEKQEARAKEIESNFTRIVETMQAKTESMARWDGKKHLQGVKHEIVEKALDDFYTMLIKLDDAEYGRIIKPLFSHIGKEPCTIYTSQKRLDVTQKHAPGYCEVKSTDELKGGFIYKTKTTTVDNSFKTLVYGEYKEGLISYFAGQLNLV